MTRLVIAPTLALALAAACGPPPPTAAPCTGAPDCNLRPGGTCLPSPLGSDQCAYPDSACAGGLSWGELSPDIGGDCVGDIDAGIDSPDAPTDARIDGPMIACSGLHVAFDDGSGPTRQQVFVAALDGSQRTPIAPSSAMDFGVTGSSDGRVSFITNRDGNLEVYRVSADGTGLANLTMNAAADGNPVFSRSGAFIVFARTGALFVMNADGTGAQAVAAGNAYLPTWSPDDSLLVFEQWTGTTEADLWIVGRGGTGLRQLTSTPGIERHPTWSPDGSKIAFGAAGDVHVINVDGSGRANLTNDAAEQFSPAWSPDGTKIAVSEGGDIKTMPAAGGARASISSGPDTDLAPEWAPDGTRIMFGRNDSTGTTHKIVVANADGSAPVAFAGPTNYVASMAWVVCP